MDNYTNLTFRVYPKGDSSYTLVHSDRSTMTVNASEDFKNGSVSVSIPVAALLRSLRKCSARSRLASRSTAGHPARCYLDEFQAAQTAYYYSSSEKLVYIKTAAETLLKLRLRDLSGSPAKRNMRSRPM